MNDHALYYPYIHIRDVNWLKATLLMFSQVRRMVPATFTPSDTPAVEEFAEYKPGLDPLLGCAAISTPCLHSQTAVSQGVCVSMRSE